jgi:hypothetical protein
MASRRAAWDQLPNESATAYRRFLIYLSLGMRRTVVAAYEQVHKDNPAAKKLAKNGRKPPTETDRNRQKKYTNASSQWYDDSRKHDWLSRAMAFDKHELMKGVQSLAASSFANLNAASGFCTRFFNNADEKTPPAKTYAAIEAMRAVNENVSTEVLLACLRGAGGDGSAEPIDESLREVQESPNLLHPGRSGPPADEGPGEHCPPDPLAAS